MNKSSISGKVFSEQSAVACDGDDGERDVLAGGGYRTLCGKLKTAAAGHLHPHERYAAHVVCVQYLAELFGVINRASSLEQPMSSVLPSMKSSWKLP